MATGTAMVESNAAVAALVRKLGRRVDALEADLGQLAETVKASTTAEAKDAAPGPPIWFGLSQDEYDTLLRHLAKFVDQRLRVDYRDYLGQVLHDCWAQHPAAVWELGNLWAEWCRVYLGDRPSLSGALAWHDRWLPGVRARLAEIMRGCSETRCRHQRPTVPGSGWGTR